MQDIWKDKKRWESVKQTKIEFGPHYVGMLKQKFGVVGNTTGVGSLLILEHVYSLIVCAGLAVLAPNFALAMPSAAGRSLQVRPCYCW